MNDGIFVIAAFVAGFVIAQGAKFIGALIKKKGKMTFNEVMYWMTRSGGMPSGHSASFIGATTAIGFIRGFTSVECAIALCMSIIIIYDAVNVRYAVGEQGKLLNEIARSDGNAKTKPQKLVEGHTIPQVIVGSIIGIAVGAISYLIYCSIM
ncbi:MAG: divergent PAP2 family protein [Candidatus Saccharibacteria bacterium]|nr:divergent PAP2 family protein [Candidatus Saccharibacteria bacterium]